MELWETVLDGPRTQLAPLPMTTSTQLQRVAAAWILLAGTGWTQVTQRVSVGSDGIQGNDQSGLDSMTPDGRFVVFESAATNFASNDTNDMVDVYIRDRLTGSTELVSIDFHGVEAAGDAESGIVSDDGRFVSFTSFARSLVPGDRNATFDAFVRDRVLRSTERISVSSSGVEGNDGSFAGRITPDGRYALLYSFATNLVQGTSYAGVQIYVRDRQNGTTEHATLGFGGAMPNRECYAASISADGRIVSFWSSATNLVNVNTNFRANAFVTDRSTGTNEIVTVATDGGPANGDCDGPTAISADGRYVAFYSYASNLVPGDTNDQPDILVRDRQRGLTERVNVSSTGDQSNGVSPQFSVSPDCRFVAFLSYATNLVPGDTNGKGDAFLRDRLNGTTERVSLNWAGVQGGQHVCNSAVNVSADGQIVGFSDFGDDLVPSDSNHLLDAFVRIREGGPTFTSLCDPGASGVTGCPCSNPPGGSDQGCDNSSATGGATLSSTGGTYISSDSLEFQVTGETPNALSLLLQGTALIPSGVVYAQGVRCVGGAMTRLATKRASGGSLTVPDFSMGESTVSSLSEAKGDLIHAGDSRYYLFFYRDPIVLGGCPTSSTFNATQTGMVTWWP